MLFKQAVGKINNVNQPQLTVLVVGNSWLARRGEGKPQLVFNKYGERHFVSQARGWETSLTLLKSEHERELVTSRLVTRNASPQIVVVAARVVR